MDESQPVANGPAAAEGDAVQPLRFTGTGREYFRIWIVNLALTVVTLGVYSAWAKVRRTQYFYRNTRLAASCFDYHGTPIAILKGRVVAVVLLAIYYVAGQLSPLYGLAAFAVLSLVIPWLLARSFRFRLHNTSYRGIRFRFRGGTGSAYWVFLGMPLLALLSFFTLVPLGFFITTVALPAWAMLLYWAFLQFIGGFGAVGEEGGGVAFWAHVGGFVAGIVLVKIFARADRVADHRAQHWEPRRVGWS